MVVRYATDIDIVADDVVFFCLLCNNIVFRNDCKSISVVASVSVFRCLADLLLPGIHVGVTSCYVLVLRKIYLKICWTFPNYRASDRNSGIFLACAKWRYDASFSKTNGEYTFLLTP